MTDHKASVIICAYTMDRWDDLNAAIASVKAQTCSAHEIILVIDEGNDVLLDRAQSEISGINVVMNRKARRLSDARQSGAEAATAPISVFLDDDAVADPDWLAHLLAPFENPNVIGTGGLIDPLWRTTKPGWFPSEFNWIVGCTYTGMPVGPGGVVRNPLGANWACRTDVVREVKFASSWGGGSTRAGDKKRLSAEACDETEFCIRVSYHYPGKLWIYCPHARVQHKVPAARVTWKYFVQRSKIEGRSKAVLSGVSGTKSALSSERRYVMFLTRATLRAIFTGNIRRGAAICIGLGATTVTYTKAKWLTQT